MKCAISKDKTIQPTPEPVSIQFKRLSRLDFIYITNRTLCIYRFFCLTFIQSILADIWSINVFSVILGSESALEIIQSFCSNPKIG